MDADRGTLTDRIQPRHPGRAVAISLDTTHGVVNGWENHHWSFVWIVINNFLIHLEQVTITCFNYITA